MLKVINPADGSIVGEVPNATPDDVRAAIGRADLAFPKWSGMLARERADILQKWHDLIKADKEEFAKIMTLENGKCLTEARGEIDYGLDFISWFAGEARRVYGDTIPTHNKDAAVLVTKHAVGVVGAITPWNFPFAMITRKISPALAAGCTVVCKPGEDTPLTAIKLMEYAHKAGVPEGVFEIVTGSNAAMIGEILTTDPRVRKISFTGSTEVGKLLVKQSADDLKKVTMELGGNAPFIVFDDCDLHKAVEGLVFAKLRNAGQTCISPNRVYVHKKSMSKFTDLLKDAVKKIPVDQGMREDFVVGPLINQKGLDKVQSLVEDAKAKGGKIVLGGKLHDKGGLFFEPTIITGLTDDFKISCTEIFGPVFALYEFDDEAEAIKRANNTEYGLVAYAYTSDLGRAFRLSQQLEAGMVILNSGAVGVASVPFGGVKHSGFGREGSHYGIEEYVEVKYVLMGGLSKAN